MDPHDDDDLHPNSAGFWRSNEMDALRTILAGVTEKMAQTPEEYEIIKQQRRRLATLKAREQKVVERYLRMQARLAPTSDLLMD